MIEEAAAGGQSPEEQQRSVDAIVARAPTGAFALAGSAVAVVMAVWLVFYVFVFVARGGA